MQAAIIPNVLSRSRPYAWGCISINPDPPRVGETATIGFPLMNPGLDDLVVERIAVRVAQFGIGVAWEELPSIGPMTLPAAPDRIETATIQWTPTQSGHRCVRATISVRGQAEALQVGRNLHVVEAAASEDLWPVPFRLGNPEPERAPIVLSFGGTQPGALAAEILVRGRAIAAGQPVWLEAGEEVDAELRLRATHPDRINAIRALEATVHGRLIDGIHVTIHRPAAPHTREDDGVDHHAHHAHVIQPEIAYVR